MSLPLAEMVYSLLTQAREQGLIRSDFSRERLSRTIANGFFLSLMQWAAYRQDLSIHEELRKTLTKLIFLRRVLLLKKTSSEPPKQIAE